MKFTNSDSLDLLANDALALTFDHDGTLIVDLAKLGTPEFARRVRDSRLNQRVAAGELFSVDQLHAITGLSRAFLALWFQSLVALQSGQPVLIVPQPDAGGAVN
jgi:hypothetical protein